VQLALMPAEKPRVPGWDVRLYTRPANDVGGDLETLSRGGVVLDLIEETTYVEQTVDLNAGDFLVAYSDGSARRVLDAVTAFVGQAAPSDNMSLIVIKRV
jgi:serine phosphatase RsbU (regulator of sigma subunit)